MCHITSELLNSDLKSICCGEPLLHRNGLKYLTTNSFANLASFLSAHKKWRSIRHDSILKHGFYSSQCCGKFVASGCKGKNADVVVWDVESRKQLIR